MSVRGLTKQFSPWSDYASIVPGASEQPCVWCRNARQLTVRRSPRFATRKSGGPGEPVASDSIAFIDQSRHWNGCRNPAREWIRLMEVLSRISPERRPASGLEVFMLSCALDCPEAPIERLRIGRSV